MNSYSALKNTCGLRKMCSRNSHVAASTGNQKVNHRKASNRSSLILSIHISSRGKETLASNICLKRATSIWDKPWHPSNILLSWSCYPLCLAESQEIIMQILISCLRPQRTRRVIFFVQEQAARQIGTPL